MAYETPLTIAEVMKDISNNKYVLPSIQSGICGGQNDRRRIMEIIQIDWFI